MDEIWRMSATKLGEALARDHFTSLPVVPHRIAKKLDIEVEALPPDKKTVSGILAQVGNVFGIQYATYIDSPGFQNFCIGHELGHYSIPGHPEKLLAFGYHESHAASHPMTAASRKPIILPLDFSCRHFSLIRQWIMRKAA